MADRQEQRGGRQSTNYQAQTINIAHGSSLAEVRDIALEIFQANFFQLAGTAAQTAQSRAEELVGNFISELRDRNPAGAHHAADPDFQYSLIIAQREYARSGDRELGDLLVNLLVDRTASEKRTTQQISLNEAIGAVPKLTNGQLAAITVVFATLNLIGLYATKRG